MDVQKQEEEKFREACCFGDIDAIMTLISRGVNVNSQHEINGWTGLHWACKRGHTEIIQLLMSHGADAEIENNQAQKPANLATSAQILQLLGAEITPATEGTTGNTDSLPITPNYIANPPIDYKVPVNPVSMKNPFGKPLTNGIESADSCSVSQYGNGVAAHPSTQTPGSNYLQDSLARQNKEIVLKVRLAHSDDPDFIEIEFHKAQINYSSLLTTCCREMAVNPQLVERIRKLPNTRLRNDKDVQRLTDYTELELVMKGQSRPPVVRSDTQSTSKNNYSSIHGFKNQTILY